MSVTPEAGQGTPGLSLQAAWAMCFVPQGTQPRLAAHNQIQPRSLLGWTTCAADVCPSNFSSAFWARLWAVARQVAAGLVSARASLG